jgi:hypothetical protein
MNREHASEATRQPVRLSRSAVVPARSFICHLAPNALYRYLANLAALKAALAERSRILLRPLPEEGPFFFGTG